MVPFGFRIACRRASWPTRRSPCGVKATTDGVVLDPSAFGITVGWPATVAEITELVVPRSMPTATAITTSCKRSARLGAQATVASPNGSGPRAPGAVCGLREHAEAGKSAGDLDLARLGGLGFGHGDRQDPVGELRGHPFGVDVAGQVSPELEPAGAARAAVAAAVPGIVLDLAGDDQ